MNIWLEWDNLTPKEYKAQISYGFQSKGSVGKLRGGGFGWFKDVLYRLFDFVDDFDKQYHSFGRKEIKKYKENLQEIIHDRSRPALRMGLITMPGYEQRQTMPIPDSEVEEYIAFIELAEKKLKQGKKLRLNVSR